MLKPAEAMQTVLESEPVLTGADQVHPGAVRGFRVNGAGVDGTCLIDVPQL